MNVLDENIRHDQAQQLRKWRIPFRWLIRDLARPGVKDPNIISLLHRTPAATFFTHDQDYFKCRLVHPAYCLVWLDAYDGEAGKLIRRFLRHPDFNSAAKRLATVVRVKMHSISYWSQGEVVLKKVDW